MRVWLPQGLVGRALLGLACLAPAGCAERPGPAIPEESLALLRAGRPVLSCREPCLAEWQRAQPQAAQLDAGGRLKELALLVMRIGYQDDLSLYYLGGAAEGIAYKPAAASYYRQSLQLSGTPVSCQNLSRQCGGIALPQAASLRLAAVERLLNPPRPRRTGSAPQWPKTPEAAPRKAETPAPGPVSSPVSDVSSPVSSVSVPVSSVSSPASSAPGPVPSPGGPGALEYIEPPAAAH